MRPTDLGFRSPKERTAEYNYPCVTFDGRFLTFAQSSNTTNLSKSRRFSQYETAAKRTGTSVGPGAYNISTALRKQWGIPGTPIIKPYVAIREPTDNGYFYSGNHMVHDINFVKRNKNTAMHLLEKRSEILPIRQSVSTHSRDHKTPTETSINRLKNSPYN